MSLYSELMGSFIRTGNFPIEADYVFESKEQLDEFYSTDLNKTLLHKGWFKIVDENESQSLYWVVESEGELKFTKLISEGSVDEINEWLEQLQTTIDEEIKKREENDEDEQTRLEYLESAIKAIVGSDESLPEYLQTLDYKNLTELSTLLNKFLNTYDDEDESINTLPELKDFLRGYSHTHNLYQVLEDLWNRIEGDPTPNLEFRTLRGIQDFITLLASTTKNRDDNLQTEINQTQVGVGLDSDGSFSPDHETYYLNNATSVMNALRILDSLINEAINNCNIQSKDTNTVSIDIVKEPTKTVISANVRISPESGNDIQSREDGLYHNVDSEYENGILTIKVNGNVRKLHVLGLSSVVDDAYYDSDKESIVIIFKLQTGDKQTVTIPVSTLITEWEVDNSISNKVVELSKDRVVAGGADKLSADVRLSSNKYNILEKDGNTLLVKGISDNIVYDGDVTVKSKLDSLTLSNALVNNQISDLTYNLQEEINRAKIAEQGLSNDITSLRTDVETKDLDLVNKIELEKVRAENAEDTLNTKIETIKSNIETNITTLISSILDALNNEITRSTQEDSALRDKVSDISINLNSEIQRATSSENLLSQRINDLKDSIDSNFNSDEAVKKVVDELRLADVTLQNNINLLENEITDTQTAISKLEDDVNSNEESIQEVKLANITQDAKITVLEDKIELVKDNIESTINTQIAGLQQALNNEINRSTLEDVSVKNSISELTSNINTEIVRASLKEEFILSKLDDHVKDYNNPHRLTAEQLNVYTKDSTNTLISEVKDNITEVKTNLALHKVDYGNPHNVTKAQIGLDKVDNTCDYEKPISNATQAALNEINLKISDKADLDTLMNHILDHDNPHLVTKELIGLGNVDNTSDLVKPISIATLMALDKKSDIGHTHTMTDITDLENLPIVKGFVDLVTELPENPSGGDKYILITQVNPGVCRYTLFEYDGSSGTWKLKLLSIGNVASVSNGDVWKLNSRGLERILDVSDYNYFYEKIYNETKDLIEDIEWEEDDRNDTNHQIRLKITYKTSYGDPNESEANNPYQLKNVKYIDIEKARFLQEAYSRPARLSDVDNGYATQVGEPVLVLVLTTGDYVVISLKDALNIYDPIDTSSVDMTVTDWDGDPDTSYKVSAVIKLASTKDKDSAVSIGINNTANDLGLYATLHTSNTNSITLNPSTGTNGTLKTLSASLNIDNSVNDNSNIKLSVSSSGLSAQFIWGEYD